MCMLKYIYGGTMKKINKIKSVMVMMVAILSLSISGCAQQATDLVSVLKEDQAVTTTEHTQEVPVVSENTPKSKETSIENKPSANDFLTEAYKKTFEMENMVVELSIKAENQSIVFTMKGKTGKMTYSTISAEDAEGNQVNLEIYMTPPDENGNITAYMFLPMLSNDWFKSESTVDEMESDESGSLENPYDTNDFESLVSDNIVGDYQFVEDEEGYTVVETVTPQSISMEEMGVDIKYQIRYFINKTTGQIEKMKCKNIETSENSVVMTITELSEEVVIPQDVLDKAQTIE